MTVYGYARVSTDGQIRQHREKSTAGLDLSPIFHSPSSKTREARAWPSATSFRTGIVHSHKARPTRRWSCLSTRVRGATPSTPATPLHRLFDSATVSTDRRG